MLLNSPIQEITKTVETPKIDLEVLLRTRLAPFPGTITRILDLLRNVNVSTKALATEVGYDPLLTTRILRLANSPCYSMQKSVNTLHQAIEAVGTKSLYEMVMVSLMANGFANEIRSSALGRLIWEHSLVVAFLSRELSKVLQIRSGDDIFIWGLLHDIGKIMLLRYDAEKYSTLLEVRDGQEMLDGERQLFGYDHTQVGGLIASRWGLPESVSQAILNHHSNTDSMTIHIINLSDILANVNGYGMRLEDESKLSNCESLKILNLTTEKLNQIWEDIQDGLQEVIDTYS